MPAEEIGRRARRPGCQVDTCYLWSIANFFLLGPEDHGDGRSGGRRPGGHGHRARLLGAGRASPTAAATARGRPGTPARPRPYDAATVAALLEGVTPITDDEHRAAVKRFSATLVNHLFLLYFDTRAGYGDTGPVRGARPARAARCSCATSTGSPRATSPGRPWRRRCRTTTSRRRSCSTACRPPSPTSARRTTPPRTTSTTSSAFGLYTTDGLPPGEVRLVPPERVRRHRRRGADGPVASTTGTSRPWTRDEKIRAGRLRVLHVPPARSPRWPASPTSSTGPCPRDLPEPLYELMSAMQGENAGVPDDEVYYDRYPEEG